MTAPVPRPIERIAIIGAGAGGPVSGATLALLCSRAGFETVLEDVLPSNLRRAQGVIEQQAPSPRLRYASSIEEAVRDADLVIDTVPDELESKLEILSLLDRMAPPHTLFATPTAVLSIADLASCTYRAGQCFGLQFIALPPEQALEIALRYAPACEAATTVRLQSVLRRLGATLTVEEDLSALP